MGTHFGGRPAGKTGMEWPHGDGFGSPFKFVVQVHSSIYGHAQPFDFFLFFIVGNAVWKIINHFSIPIK
ncbi:hypothetical protein [Flagellimonas sp. S3867]|uniref:hypothetical protein n=1 Tax=Flagellimonas sp. S3867 TaxID=2768063 RepID=UPI00168A0FD8|nr:hypothetical protein [Flagellimonas sp. S3867]